jgi:membrane-associated phospholipid phosphatase
MIRRCAIACLLLCFSVSASWAQGANSSAAVAASIFPSQSKTAGDSQYPDYLQPGADPQNRLLVPLIKHIGEDQKQFWTFPTRLRRQDLKWIIPGAAGLAGLFAADSWISQQVPDRPDQINRSLKISDYSVYSLIGAGGAAFIFGKLTKNEHMRETGFLSAEAAINATAVTYAFKVATSRQRPYVSNADGDFFSGHPSSTSLSFPSEHSAIAWSIAGVIAHEYPGPLTKFGAYGLATTVSLTRVTARQHFTSDVVIGGILGWYFAHEVYRAHHNPELGGQAWGDYVEPNNEPKQRMAQNMGSPYVPLDSPVYPMLDRMAALGLIKTAYAGIRPWTRMECARLLDEASEQVHSEDGAGTEATGMYNELAHEFAPELSRLEGAENLGVSLDSLYVRGTQISGKPLTDGYHFAQTLTNNFGRPYAQGFNSVSGFTAHAVAGPLAFALQGEYQHAPAIAPYSSPVQQAIAVADATTAYPAGRPGVDRFDLLAGTVGFQFHNFEVTAGKQSFWWSVADSDSLLLSNNAEPIVAIKLDNVSPYHFPLLSKIFGDARSEYFLGRLDGHTIENDIDHLIGPTNIQPQPFLQGLKLSFKPTQNLEFGAGFTAMFGGPGSPFTLKNFLRTFYSHTSNPATNPGKRIASFDFSYRIPGLRNWLTIYRDSLAVDEYTPLTSTRPSLNMGLYMPKLPKLHKVDFRAEVIGTPHTHEFPPGFVYWDFRRYRQGYTNDGNLLASWMGRAGRGGQGWMTYWLSPRSTLQFSYRYEKVDRDFLEGGHLDDFTVKPTFFLTHDLGLTGVLQFEHWYFPLLAATGQSNTTAEVQLTFIPHLHARK